jgi:hypothetical protein
MEGCLLVCVLQCVAYTVLSHEASRFQASRCQACTAPAAHLLASLPLVASSSLACSLPHLTLLKSGTTETEVTVTSTRTVEDATSRPRVPRVADPATATQHPVAA